MHLNGKFVNLSQLRDEARTANVVTATTELGTFGDYVFPYDNNGQPTDFLDTNAMQTIITNHAPVRPLTDSEITVKYAQANDATPPDMSTMHRLVAMMQGLVPRDTVPMQPPTI